MSKRLIGDVNLISIRNFDSSKPYKLLRPYAGNTKRELKDNQGKSVNEAMNNLTKSVPGGEYLVNVKIYALSNRKYLVEGDVWGLEENIQINGFRVGDKVKFKKGPPLKSKSFNLFGSKTKSNQASETSETGVIKHLTNHKVCSVLIDGTDKVLETEYDDIIKY